MSTSPVRVTHIITDLDVGGAEMLLYRLLRRTHGRSITANVISLEGDGPVAKEIRELGIPVRSFNLSRGPRAAGAIPRIVAELRRSRPDVVQTWMYRADVLGGIAASVARVPVAWGLHAAPLPDAEPIDMQTRMGLRTAAALSRWVPSRIVCCSFETQRAHTVLHYDRPKLIVIPNGFELADRDDAAPAAVRNELDLPTGTPLVGRVGRDHPQKDTLTLFAAFALVRSEIPDARLVLVGEGFTRDNHVLNAALRSAGLSDAEVIFLGPREDIVRLNSAFDVVVSSSYSEGLPVVLGEAMSVGTPVVTTDVGDAALMVDDPSRVVRPRDPKALAAAMIDVLQLDERARLELGTRDRERVRTGFSFDTMVSSYESLYRELSRRAA